MGFCPEKSMTQQPLLKKTPRHVQGLQDGGFGFGFAAATSEGCNHLGTRFSCTKPRGFYQSIWGIPIQNRDVTGNNGDIVGDFNKLDIWACLTIGDESQNMAIEWTNGQWNVMSLAHMCRSCGDVPTEGKKCTKPELEGLPVDTVIVCQQARWKPL